MVRPWVKGSGRGGVWGRGRCQGVGLRSLFSRTLNNLTGTAPSSLPSPSVLGGAILLPGLGALITVAGPAKQLEIAIRAVARRVLVSVIAFGIKSVAQGVASEREGEFSLPNPPSGTLAVDVRI